MEEIDLEKSQLKKSTKVRHLTITSMLSALLIVLGITGLGYIPIPPFDTTIMHIPVIIGSILEGPIVGGILGFIFGLTSMFQAIKSPTPVSFIFLNPLVSILPRILIGITPWLIMKFFKFLKRDSFKISTAAFIGSFTNTIGVLSMIYILYFHEYIKILGVSEFAANSTFIALGLNGFISAGVSIAISLPVVLSIKKYKNNHSL